MKSKICLVLVALAVTTVLATHETHTYHKHETTVQHSPGLWQGFKNALNDMNPFGSRLGHNWEDTQMKAEDIYEDMLLTAQRRVADLKEDAMLKENAALQKRIADIYIEAGAEAERRIDRLKRPILGGYFMNKDTTLMTDEERTLYQKTRDAYEKATDSVKDAAYKARDSLKDGTDYVKHKYNKFESPFHAQSSFFEDTSNTVSNAYKTAIAKAKNAASKVEPVASETWEQTKLRAQKVYDDIVGAAHHDSRSTWRKFRDTIMSGGHKMGDFAESAAIKTWHLVLHIMLAIMWTTIGGIVALALLNQSDKRTFNKQLHSNITGPVVLNKEFWVVGTDEYQRKFQDYWTNTAANFLKTQPGFRKFCFERGLNVGSSTYHACSEWNSLDELRRALSHPNLIELKKRMPREALSKHSIAQVMMVTKGGPNDVVNDTSSTLRSSNDNLLLRNRGGVVTGPSA